MEIWIVVHTYRGLIQSPEIFNDYRTATRRRIELESEANPDYDEVALFEKQIL